jgi:glyoxylase-like metal-dependent hydrolase (beta-lactamase superfamily II)
MEGPMSAAPARLRVRALTCGWLTADLGLFLTGEHGTITAPVPCYLIEHPRGTVVFDSGLHPAIQHDQRGRLGERITKLFPATYHPGEEIGARLGALGVEPGSVDWLVNSHLHFDHCGGNAQLPNARLAIQRREWDAGRDPDLQQRMTYDPRDYDLGHDRLLVDGEHDLFGDGSVVCVPTWGHTPGHQSMRIRLDGGRTLLLAADACYLRRTLDELLLAPFVYEQEASLAVLHRMRAWQASGVTIFYGHDPDFWAGVPQAPADIV